MKITVKNLGVLRQAEFDLGDLTIICGGNNSGKTYATYALYGFLKTWRNYRGPMRQGRKIPKRSIEELMNDGVTVIDLTEYVRKAEAALDDMCDWYTDRLSSVFAAPRERFRDTRFRVSLDRDALSESVKSKSVERALVRETARLSRSTRPREARNSGFPCWWKGRGSRFPFYPYSYGSLKLSTKSPSASLFRIRSSPALSELAQPYFAKN